MPTLSQILQSRTILFAILLAVLPIIPAYVGAFNLTPIQQMLVLQVVAAIVAVLRLVTTTAVGDK